MNNLFSLTAVTLLLGLSSFCPAQAPPEVEADPIRKQLDTEIAEYLGAIEKAESKLRATLEAQIQTISSRLDIEKRLLRRAELEREVDAYLSAGAEPEDRKLRKASKAFAKRAGLAADRCCDAYKVAARKYWDGGDPDEAAAIWEERKDLLLEHGYWVPPIPSYVSIDIEGLRDHRPGYTRILEDELDAVVSASRRRDRLRFRRAVDSAIAATRASKVKGEGLGCYNSREDIILVLETLRAGRGDLRQLRFHFRDHRIKKWHTGLPGVDYK